MSAATSDPYVELFAGELYWRTRVVPKNLDPRWDEEATFEVSSCAEVLHVVLFDWNTFNKHEYLGEKAISLCDLKRAGDKIEDWFLLDKPDSISGGVSGEVFLSITLTKTGTDQYGAGWHPDERFDRLADHDRRRTAITDHRQGTMHGTWSKLSDGAGVITKIERPLLARVARQAEHPNCRGAGPQGQR